jgi:hypothetical protein
MGNCWSTPANRPIEKEMKMGNMREISIEECNAVFGGRDQRAHGGRRTAASYDYDNDYGNGSSFISNGYESSPIAYGGSNAIASIIVVTAPRSGFTFDTGFGFGANIPDSYHLRGFSEEIYDAGQQIFDWALQFFGIDDFETDKEKREESEKLISEKFANTTPDKTIVVLGKTANVWAADGWIYVDTDKNNVFDQRIRINPDGSWTVDYGYKVEHFKLGK